MAKKNDGVTCNDSLDTKWLNTSTIDHEFTRMLSETLIKSSDEMEQPIVWKTILSQKNRYLGEYVVAKVDTHTFPILSQSSLSHQKIVYKPTHSKKDSFFQKHFGMGFDGISGFPSMNQTISLNLLMVHILLFKTNNTFDPSSYTARNFRKILDSPCYKSLKLHLWYPNISELIKSAKKNCSLIQKNTLPFSDFFRLYDTNLPMERSTARTQYFDNGFVGLRRICIRGINATIVQFIQELRQDFLWYVFVFLIFLTIILDQIQQLNHHCYKQIS